MKPVWLLIAQIELVWVRFKNLEPHRFLTFIAEAPRPYSSEIPLSDSKWLFDLIGCLDANNRLSQTHNRLRLAMSALGLRCKTVTLCCRCSKAENVLGYRVDIQHMVCKHHSSCLKVSWLFIIEKVVVAHLLYNTTRVRVRTLVFEFLLIIPFHPSAGSSRGAQLSA